MANFRVGRPRSAVLALKCNLHKMFQMLQWTFKQCVKCINSRIFEKNNFMILVPVQDPSSNPVVT